MSPNGGVIVGAAGVMVSVLVSFGRVGSGAVGTVGGEVKSSKVRDLFCKLSRYRKVRFQCRLELGTK